MFADQHPQDPQSWNLYAYVRNDPLRFFDTDGRELKENREIVHYQVSGSNAQEALSAANAHFSGDFAGQTSLSIHVSYSFSSESASTTSGATVTDTITSDTVTSNQKIELPDWTGRNEASADDHKTWDSAVSTLMGHEEGNADINRQGADNLDKSLPGTKASGAGPDAQAAGKSAEQNLGGKVQDKIRTSLSDTEKNNASYDSRTDHGRKQNQ